MSVTPDDLNRLWQRQALDAPRINLAYLLNRTSALQHRARMRNGFEYASGLAGIAWGVWFAWDFIVTHPIFGLGTVLWIFGTLFVMLQWHRRAAAQAPAEQLGTLDALAFYRQQLERQRDARRGNWRWWLPPLVPCVIVIFVAFLVEVRPIPWIPIAGFAAWVVLGVSLGIAGYERAARGIQREIDALDSMKSGS